MDLPAQFVTIESVGTVLGLTTALWLALMVGHIAKAPRAVQLVIGIGSSFLLNLMVVVTPREILVLNLVIAGFNSCLTFIGAWFAYSKTAPLWDKLGLL